jgi:TDG/mug DNA glycosylase family protein
MDQSACVSFPYIAAYDARALILGSMPGAASLAANAYYAHPRNAFWRILADLWGCEPLTDYPSRYAFLYAKRIALWDAARACIRQGSADHTIREARLNDIPSLLAKYPGIRHVFLNGTKAAELFGKCELPPASRDIPRTLMPSTSPANTAPYESKLAAWAALRRTLEEQYKSD